MTLVLLPTRTGPRARTSSLDMESRQALASWLDGRAGALIWSASQRLIDAGTVARYQSQPTFMAELRAWLSDSFEIFARILRDGRSSMSLREGARLASYANRGAHAEVPLHVLRTGICFVSDEIFSDAINEALVALPGLASSRALGEIVGVAVGFRQQILDDLDHARSDRLILGRDAWMEAPHLLVTRGDATIPLTPRESDILATIARANGLPVSRTRLGANPQSVRERIRTLRLKLRRVGLDGCVVTVRSDGYAWQPIDQS